MDIVVVDVAVVGHAANVSGIALVSLSVAGSLVAVVVAVVVCARSITNPFT